MAVLSSVVDPMTVTVLPGRVVIAVDVEIDLVIVLAGIETVLAGRVIIVVMTEVVVDAGIVLVPSGEVMVLAGCVMTEVKVAVLAV